MTSRLSSLLTALVSITLGIGVVIVCAALVLVSATSLVLGAPFALLQRLRSRHDSKRD